MRVIFALFVSQPTEIAKVVAGGIKNIIKNATLPMTHQHI